jgi:predicted nicotinamide N-methyase
VLPPDAGPGALRTSAGDVALEEFRIALAGREWTVLHTGAVLSHDDEQRYLSDASPRLPYGVALWPAAIALAHDVAARPDAFRGRTVLELGAGTGLPGSSPPRAARASCRPTARSWRSPSAAATARATAWTGSRAAPPTGCTGTTPRPTTG